MRIDTSSVPLLSTLLPSINSVDDVDKILHAVDKSQFCIGNEIEKFAKVVDGRNGTLSDSQGTYMYMYRHIIYMRRNIPL